MSSSSPASLHCPAAAFTAACTRCAATAAALASFVGLATPRRERSGRTSTKGLLMDRPMYERIARRTELGVPWGRGRLLSAVGVRAAILRSWLASLWLVGCCIVYGPELVF